MQKLTTTQIQEKLVNCPGWTIDGLNLTRQNSFKDFAEGLTFVNKVGEIAEKLNHHPDIHLSWGTVMVAIHTHSIGGLTELDFKFAGLVSEIS